MECDSLITSAQAGKDWVDYLSALLVPTIAILGSIVALQQWKTNAKRLKHELFDRRYKQFESIRKFLGSIITTGKVSQKSESEFLSNTRGIRFIFDEETSVYINETIWKLSNQFESLNSSLDGMPAGEERSKLVNERTEIRKNLNSEFMGLEKKFEKYLQLQD